MNFSKFLNISSIGVIVFLQACSTFNYKTYDEKYYKDVDDPEPNYEITLDRNFQDFTSFMFIGNRIENFSTYFNTYFNANEKFNEAYDDYVTRVLVNYSEKQDSIFAKPQLSQEAIDKFTVAIEKASKVIQYHKSSLYMDNAVLLVGKSYFYLGDYLKAERKFSEFISKLKASTLLDEALLFLARTQLRLENDKPALERLNELIKNSKDNNIVSGSYQSLAEYWLNKKDYENAVKNFKKAIQYSDDSEFKAQMQFLVASVEAKSNPKLAAAEFDKVLDFNASYDLEYLAKLNRAKYLIACGKYSSAKDLIEDMEVKYKDEPQSLSRVNYLHAVYYEERKDQKNSLSSFYEVIKDFPATVSSADASFKIGKYFEQNNNYLNALMYYRFSTEQSNKGTYYSDASKKAGIFKRYFELRSIITGNTIKTEYDDEFKKNTTKENKQDPGNPIKGLDNGKSGGIKSQFTDSTINSEDSTITIADTTHAQEKIISAAKFELAELFLYDLNRTDSSEIYLKEALNESYDYDFSAKVLFALSALYRKTEEIAKSDEILRTIIKDYPYSPVANSSRKLLNISVENEYRGDPGDSIYSTAENNFVSGNYTASLNDFITLINKYPASVHLDKAYYGAGWIYENVLFKNDSAYNYYSMLVNGSPGSEAAAMVIKKVEEYESFNNLKDTSSVNKQNQEPLNNNQPSNNEELKKSDTEQKENKENDNIPNKEQINDDNPNNDGNVDPGELNKQQEEKKENPDNNNNEAPNEKSPKDD